MMPLVAVGCFTDQESMLFVARYHICAILGLRRPWGTWPWTWWGVVYLEPAMAPRTQPRPRNNAPGTRPGLGMPGVASNRI